MKFLRFTKKFGQKVYIFNLRRNYDFLVFFLDSVFTSRSSDESDFTYVIKKPSSVQQTRQLPLMENEDRRMVACENLWVII